MSDFNPDDLLPDEIPPLGPWWDYVGNSSKWPEMAAKWAETKATFIKWAREALATHNLVYAAHCRSQAMHYHKRIQQRRLFPR